MSNTFARELRKSMTDTERKLWRGLRMRQMHGHKFRRQFPLGSYIVDFVCLEARLIIEVDGGQHADEENGDTQRDAWLTDQKFRVLRYWNNQVLNELDAVLADIARVVEVLPPIPAFPRKGGRRMIAESSNAIPLAGGNILSWICQLLPPSRGKVGMGEWGANSPMNKKSPDFSGLFYCKFCVRYYQRKPAFRL